MPKRKLPEVVLDVDRAIDKLSKETTLALDLETGGLNPWRDPLAVVSLYGEKANVAAVLHVRGVLPERLQRFLGDSDREIIAHNGVGFDYLFLSNAGVNLERTPLYDTMPLEAALLSNGRNNLGVSLKATCKRHLGVELDKSIDHGHWMDETLTQEQIAYCVGDIAYLVAIKKAQQAIVAKDPQRAKAVALELAIMHPVLQMELNGIPISLTELRKYMGGTHDRIEQLERTLRERLGDINLGSVPQLKRAFKERYGLEMESTDKEHLFFLSQFAGAAGETAGHLLKYRYEVKRANVYDADWISRYVVDGRVHGRFWQCGTETGRFSSSEPNLQQIPRDMRYIFGHRDGHKFVKGDYSQIEIRTIAAFANDLVMLAALEQEDIHRSMASDILEIPLGEVTKDQRKVAKAVSFNLLFGGGVNKLYRYARQQGSALTIEEARALVRRFFNKYQGAAELKSQAYAAVSSGHAVIELPGGLKRVLAGASAKGTTWLDTLAQGTAAAGMKLALHEAYKAGLTSRLVEVVHDELGCIVPTDEAADFAGELEACMLKGMARVTQAPLAVEMSVSDSWPA